MAPTGAPPAIGIAGGSSLFDATCLAQVQPSVARGLLATAQCLGGANPGHAGRGTFASAVVPFSLCFRSFAHLVQLFDVVGVCFCLMRSQESGTIVVFYSHGHLCSLANIDSLMNNISHNID